MTDSRERVAPAGGIGEQPVRVKVIRKVFF